MSESPIQDTLPWKYTGATRGLGDRSYAIGVIYSVPLGCAVVEVSYGGNDIVDAIAKVDAFANFVIERCR